MAGTTGTHHTSQRDHDRHQSQSSVQPQPGHDPSALWPVVRAPGQGEMCRSAPCRVAVGHLVGFVGGVAMQDLWQVQPAHTRPASGIMTATSSSHRHSLSLGMIVRRCGHWQRQQARGRYASSRPVVWLLAIWWALWVAWPCKASGRYNPAHHTSQRDHDRHQSQSSVRPQPGHDPSALWPVARAPGRG